MKPIFTLFTIIVLPVVLFGILLVGMTFLSPKTEPTPTSTEQHMLSPKEPSTTCGNGICEKNERDDTSCAEDC